MATSAVTSEKSKRTTGRRGRPVTDEVERVELAGRLRTAFGRINRRLRHTRSRSSLSPSQWEVLATVARAGRMRVGDVAEQEGLNPTMLSRISGKLDAEGLVERVQDEQDARVAHLAITPAGRRLYAAVRTERTVALRTALDQLGDRDRRALIAALPALEALAEHLREGAP